jgi:hypothetical protein
MSDSWLTSPQRVWRRRWNDMSTKTKNEVKPSFTQEEAKELTEMLWVQTATLESIGDTVRAERCAYLRNKIVQASGKTPE